jgi:hypothetical protein
MDSNDGPYHPVGRSGKAKDHGKTSYICGTPPRPLTGQMTRYSTKIRVILIKRHPNQDLQVGSATKALLTQMITLDDSLTIESCVNPALSFNSMNKYMKDKEEFLKIFEYRELHKEQETNIDHYLFQY